VVRLSLAEWAVLAALAERPAHLFAVARLLGKNGELGQLLTVRRPLVYRAAERLAAAALCRPDHTEPGEGGPERTVYRVTPAGRRALAAWLREPVSRIRDLRPEFLLKVRLTVRAGVSALPLVEAQQAALAPVFSRLIAPEAGEDEVSLWRRHTVAATRAYLEDLAARLRAGGPADHPGPAPRADPG
jgi:DNA-binding PadR family transcriptional regulator